MQQRFEVTGMTCSACSAHVDKSVRKLSGVADVAVNLLQNNMTVTYDENAVTDSDIIKAVEDAGYGAYIKGAAAMTKNREDPAKAEAAAVKKRLIYSLVFMVPLLYLAMGHMLGAPLPAFLIGVQNTMVNALTQLVLTAPILVLNRHFFTGGFRALVNRAPNMDSLVGVGAAAAVVYSTWMLFLMAYALGRGQIELAHTYGMDLYFESAGVILTLITVGKLLEARSKGKTSEAIEKLLSLAPKTAIVLRDGQEVEVPVEEVAVGDILIVRTGQGIPVDGEIIEGHGAVDESALTGESAPVDKEKGSKVIGSTINRSGYFQFRATKVGDDTTFAQIIRLVEQAGASKAPIAKLADKVSGIFVPVVMGIATISAVVWLIVGAQIGFALSIGIAVLVISCPCALGLATPTAIMVGTGKGAELGILIKSAESLEIAHTVDTVILDKTGTVTEGKPQVTDVLAWTPAGEDEMVRLAASAETLSEHPLGQAVVDYAKGKNLDLLPAGDLQSYAGAGIACTVDGDTIRVGNAAMMERFDVPIKESGAQDLAEMGKTVLYVARDHTALGAIAVADVIKPTSREAVETMERMGLDVFMLTGDNEKTAKAVAQQAGVRHVIAQVLPQDKELWVRRLQEEGHKVAMVGDGVNDAPALVRADVGIAIGAGTDVAIESADIVLIKSDLMDAVNAVLLSRATIRNIKQNLFWAFFYNIIGIPLAAGVLYPLFAIKLNPMFAAAAMSMSSFFVVTNALRLKLFNAKKARMRQSSKALPKAVDVETRVEVLERPVPPACPLLPKETPDRTQKDTAAWTMRVSGMTCKHCKETVEKALLGVSGVISATVHLEEGLVDITAVPGVLPEAMQQAVEAADYAVESLTRCDVETSSRWRLNVLGMTCEHCKTAVEKALMGVVGVKHVDVNLQENMVDVEAMPDVSPEAMQQAVEAADYDVASIVRDGAQNRADVPWRLRVNGMTCEHCKNRVETALSGLDGVRSAVVNLKEGTVDVVAAPDVSQNAMQKAVEAADYTVEWVQRA